MTVPLLALPTTPQRAADVLRDRVLAGQLRPGAQVTELELSTAFGISRNTLREAFQILIGERLLVREPHRGVFVRVLTADDVRDIYAFRRLVECAALLRPAHGAGLEQMRDAVREGRAGSAARDWPSVGTADVRFHLGVIAVAGSRRLDRSVRGLFAELRLAFHLVPDPQALHEPFLELNGRLLGLVEDGAGAQAAALLERYLDDAESVVVRVLGG